MDNTQELKFHAMELQQGKSNKLYCFAVDAKTLPSFTAITRIKRNEANAIVGYQRPEVLSHIQEIKNYIESENPMIPNAIVVAFDDSVSFEPLDQNNPDANTNGSNFGILSIPFNPTNGQKPGWIVDGQQRLAAIREARIDQFPIYVIGFIAKDSKEQVEQFILVNSTKPLPKGLIYELLPHTDASLPSLLRKRKYPAYISHLLNTSDESPLKGMINTPTNPEGVIKDNPILKMIENSLSDGALFRFRDPDSGDWESEKIVELMYNFWSAVEKVFPEAWGLKPVRSRLMHGAGIVSLGFLMDTISERYSEFGIPTEDHYISDLKPLKEHCSWTSGVWEFGPEQKRNWNEIQNIPSDVRLLTNYLLIKYREHH